MTIPRYRPVPPCSDHLQSFFDEMALGFGDVPETLYHYTTQSGLIGIIRGNELWMSHTQYLNDTQEFRHAIELAEKEIQGRISVATAGEEKVILHEMLSGLDPSHSDINVCVACFSEVGDSLSQWRAYGGGVAGYSIGFCGSFLSQVAGRELFLLARCIYDDEEKRRLVAKFIEANLQEIAAHRDLPENVEGDRDCWRRGGDLLAHLNSFGPVLKDSSFADEREWRIISRPLNCTLAAFDYRPGASMIIPYYRLPIGESALPIRIGFEDTVNKRLRTIVVGPTPHRDQAENAVHSLLASQRLATGPVNVEISKVPYRAW